MMKPRRSYAKAANSKQYVKKSKYAKVSFSRRMYNKSQAHVGEISVKCEADVVIMTVSGSAGYFLAGNTVKYFNLTNAIVNSLTWTTMSPLYSKFKITSLTVTVMPVSTSSSPVYSTVVGAPHFYVNFSPDKVSTDLGTACLSSDSSLCVNPVATDVNANSKTYYFPNNYFPGPGIGLGVWNNPSNIANLLGQFCLFTPGTGSTSYQNYTPFFLLIRVNIIFDQLNK